MTDVMGLGIDLCAISRMERHLLEGSAFLRRCFTEEEQAYLRDRGRAAARSMAAMFAAKEALLKAMGTGLGGGIALRDIAVMHRESGQPYYVLTGGAAEKLAALGAKAAHVSLTHEADMAAAVAVIWG